MRLIDQSRDGLTLKRRLRWWQIFFISFGGVVGIGFFRGSSTTLGVSGPAGALIATLAVGLIAIIVMEAICELINIWPISNAMVEYVRVFVDEDLAVAVGILYWYTYCITFSALVIAVGDLADYWSTGDNLIAYPVKALIYVCVPLLLLFINALPVKYYGWIEFIGGTVKLVLIIGTVILMICINLGVGYDGYIGTKYLSDAVQNNEHVASSHAVAVFASIPKAIFAYIGVELLTTTAFEARDPADLRIPARNIGWFSLVMYALATGSFVANVSWQDPQLPKLFQQALTTITDPTVRFEPIRPNVHAAPLIALLRLNFRFLPGFLNACFIYSALSCANTALYVASRQLYGLTRSISVDRNDNWLRRFCAWIGSVDHRTKSPWIALFISVLLTCWVPFIRRHDALVLQEIQDVLTNLGSVSCILVWCSQCIAYILFFHWRDVHMVNLQEKSRYQNLLDKKNSGWLFSFQPYLSWAGAGATFLVVFFFNTASMWNGDHHTLTLKALSAFISPAVLLLIYLIKKFTRPKQQRKFFNSLSDWSEFERQITYLNDLIYPGEIATITTISVSGESAIERPAPRPTSADKNRVTSWTRGDLTLITNQYGSAFERTNSTSPLPVVSPIQSGQAISPQGYINPKMSASQHGMAAPTTGPTYPAVPTVASSLAARVPSQMMHSGYMRPSASQSHSRSNLHLQPHPASNLDNGTTPSDSAHHSDSFLSRTHSATAFNPYPSHNISPSLSPEWTGYHSNYLTRNMSNVSELGEGDGEEERRRERNRQQQQQQSQGQGQDVRDHDGNGNRMYELPSLSFSVPPTTRGD